MAPLNFLNSKDDIEKRICTPVLCLTWAVALGTRSRGPSFWKLGSEEILDIKD
jgi:hypothetical protein